MLLTITDAGHARETDALATGIFPSVEAVLIGDGVPHAAEAIGGATGLVHQILSVPVDYVVRVSPLAVRLHATVPVGQTITIRELGLLLADGTLYGYLPYQTVTGSALVKDTRFAFSFSLAVSRDPLPDMTVNYDPLDTADIAADIADQSLSNIANYGARLGSAENAITAEASARAAAVSAEATARSAADAAETSARNLAIETARIEIIERAAAPVNGAILTYVEGRLTSINESMTTGLVRSTAYQYDEDGRMTEAVSTLRNTRRSERFYYAPSGELSSISVTESPV